MTPTAAFAISPIHPATYASVCLELTWSLPIGPATPRGSGTGFLYRGAPGTDELFLITSWHVVTGRSPEPPHDLLPGYPRSPDAVVLCMPTATDHRFFLPINMELYAAGRPVWLEAAPLRGRVDLVAIPVRFAAGVHVVAVQDFAEPGGRISIGDDVVLVGFPFGRIDRNPLAIWKKAMIASEPSTLLSGLPRHVLDTPGRPGMSGSPVYAKERATAVTRQAAALLRGTGPSDVSVIGQLSPSDFLGYETFELRLVGVYCGSYGHDALRDMALGFSWLAPVVDRVLDERLPGTNPYPP